MNNLTSKDISAAIKIAWDGVDNSIIGPMIKPCLKDGVVLSAKTFEELKKEGKYDDVLFRMDSTAFQVFMSAFHAICPKSAMQGDFSVKDDMEGDNWKKEQ